MNLLSTAVQSARDTLANELNGIRPTDKRYNPLSKAIGQLDAGALSASIAHGFGAKTAAGETTFHGKPIPEAIANAFRTIIDAATAAEVAEWQITADAAGEDDPRTAEEIETADAETAPATVSGWESIDTSIEDEPAPTTPADVIPADVAANLAHTDAEPAELVALADPFDGSADAEPLEEIPADEPAPAELPESIDSAEDFRPLEMSNSVAGVILRRMTRRAYRHQWDDPARTEPADYGQAEEAAQAVLFWILTRPEAWWKRRTIRRGDWTGFSALANGIGRRMQWRTPGGTNTGRRSSRRWNGSVTYNPTDRTLHRWSAPGKEPNPKTGFPMDCEGQTIIVNGTTCRISERIDRDTVRLDRETSPTQRIPAPLPKPTGDHEADMKRAEEWPKHGTAYMPRGLERDPLPRDVSRLPNPATQAEAWDERNPIGVKRIGYEQLRYHRTVQDRDRRYLAAYGAGYEERTTGATTSVPGGKGRYRRSIGKGWGNLVTFPAGEIPETESRCPGERHFTPATVAGDWSLTPEDFDSDIRRCRGDRPEPAEPPTAMATALATALATATG